MTITQLYEPLNGTAGKYTLLNVGRNHKTVKGDKQGEWLTGILYLAPADQSGYNVCPSGTEACRKSCLFFAGNGNMAHVKNARIRKTRQYFEQRAEFMRDLVQDIQMLKSQAAEFEMQPAVRLNGTSDILWERQPVTLGDTIHPNIMAAFPDVQFYDYTKIWNRHDLPENYRLVFSLSDKNEALAKQAFERGMNVAVVFRKEPPATFWGRQVINGDKDDLRFLDPAGVIVGLKAKGSATRDNKGFVKDPESGPMKEGGSPLNITINIQALHIHIPENPSLGKLLSSDLVEGMSNSLSQSLSNIPQSQSLNNPPVETPPESPLSLKQSQDGNLSSLPSSQNPGDSPKKKSGPRVPSQSDSPTSLHSKESKCETCSKVFYARPSAAARLCHSCLTEKRIAAMNAAREAKQKK